MYKFHEISPFDFSELKFSKDRGLRRDIGPVMGPVGGGQLLFNEKSIYTPVDSPTYDFELLFVQYQHPYQISSKSNEKQRS